MSIDCRSEREDPKISTQTIIINKQQKPPKTIQMSEEMQVEENVVAEATQECEREQLAPIQEEQVEVVQVQEAQAQVQCQAQAQETSAQAALLNEWSQYSTEEIQLELPELPPPDYKCYAVPEVPPGVTRWFRINEPIVYKDLAVNLDKLAVENRVNNTHVNLDKTVITNVNRHHDHTLKIITNENNFEKNITNKIIRVADIHKQRVENIAGPVKTYKEYKVNQKIEGPGCQKQSTQIIKLPATTRLYASTVTQRANSNKKSIFVRPNVYGRVSELAPSTPTPVRYI